MNQANIALWIIVAIVGVSLIIPAFNSPASLPMAEKQAQNIPLPISADPLPAPIKEIEPEWTEEKPLRNVDASRLGSVLADIESHMPAGHIYRDSDYVTWGHETSHGIASRLRQKHSGSNVMIMVSYLLLDGHEVVKLNAGINVFYVLNNKAVIIREPNTTISRAAALVPRSLRGRTYQLYMVSQAASWGDTPLYIFDEFVAYSNGAEVRYNRKMNERGDTVESMLHFSVYAMCVAQACKTDDPQFKNFLAWSLKRSMILLEKNKELGGTSQAEDYWTHFKTSSDAQSLRSFIKEYLGTDWCHDNLGI